MIYILFLFNATDVKITKKTLDNGLRVLFVEDHSLPIFCGVVQFDVGSAYERLGITGVSHLLEHMLFKGSKKLGTIDYKKEEKLMKKLWELYSKKEKGDESVLEEIKKIEEEIKKLIISEEIWTIYASHGGSMMNASTGEFSTQYFVVLPSNKKELWAMIESDRFTNIFLREFYSERDVVNEERRMGEGRPQSVLWDHISTTAFLVSPVRNPVIGWESDIMNITPWEVQDYFNTYYIPERCIILLAGDVYPEKDIKLIEKYFGRWKNRKSPIIRFTEEPEQLCERRTHVIFDCSDMYSISFKTPRLGEREYYAALILSQVLGYGESSILKKYFVDKGIATEASAYLSDNETKAPSLFIVFIYPKDNTSFERITSDFYALLDSIKTKGINDEDIKKVKNRYKKWIIDRQKNILWFSFGILKGERIFNDPEFYKKEMKILDSITKEDCIAVIEKYLVKDKASIVTMGRKK